MTPEQMKYLLIGMYVGLLIGAGIMSLVFFAMSNEK